MGTLKFRRAYERSHRNLLGAFAPQITIQSNEYPAPGLGILSDFAQQLYRVSLPRRSSGLQELWRDQAPRFTPKNPIRPQGVLRHYQRRCEQQSRALQRRSIRPARFRRLLGTYALTAEYVLSRHIQTISLTDVPVRLTITFFKLSVSANVSVVTLCVSSACPTRSRDQRL
jgi:hypothetical protein